MRKAAKLLGLGLAGLVLAGAVRRRLRRLDLRGRVAVVTGGGRGLGLAITRELVQRGCRVAICGRDGELIHRSVRGFQVQGADVIGRGCDASDAAQVDSFFAWVVEQYGHIELLVNNAGQCFVGPAAELQAEDMQGALRNIFWAQYYPTMAVLPQMRSRKLGRIANVTSIGGKLPLPHQAAYVTAKYAATGWSETLGVELRKEGVYVSTISPPPLRNGAPLHVHFNGRVEEEFGWFTRSLTSRLSAIGAERAARTVVDALAHADPERAVSLSSWLLSRAHGLAPTLTARCLGWVDRLLPPAAAPGVSSRMRLGADIVAQSTDDDVQRLARRARRDEARYTPAPASAGGVLL
jgi:NAD(P)-dependent dehydrogenase (short-subunit alcohol dehydrogenase family)